jgi:hypothetical protein
MARRTTQKKRLKSEDYYAPVDTLTDLLGKLLRLKIEDKELDDRKYAGEDIKKDKNDLEKKHKLLNKQKVDVLNRHIFRAMANLTYLLEMMQHHPYIHKRFEGDIKALFLTKSSVVKKHKSIFERFIEASCMTTLTERGKPLPDFRLILIDMMQQLIFRKMQVIGPRKFNDTSFWEKTMMADMERAVAWIREVAHEALLKEFVDEKRRKKARREEDSENDSESVTRPALF